MSESPVRLRTDVFDDLCKAQGYRTQGAVARALGVSYSQLGKVRAHASQPGPKFIHATLGLLGVPYAAVFARAKKEQVA